MEEKVFRSPELLAHERGDQTAQVAAAAGAADNDIWHYAVLIQRDLGLQTNDGLVQQDLVEHAPQYITITVLAGGGLHCLGDGTA